jgi:hypothetical protein
MSLANNLKIEISEKMVNVRFTYGEVWEHEYNLGDRLNMGSQEQLFASTAVPGISTVREDGRFVDRFFRIEIVDGIIAKCQEINRHDFLALGGEI